MSRRNLLFGGFLGEFGRQETIARTDTPESTDVQDLLARSRNRAPWESAGAPREGVRARVLVFDCLVTLGSPCSSCSERCPEPGAIVLDARGVPRIDASHCTGCGDCVLACPAPRTAIAMGAR